MEEKISRIIKRKSKYILSEDLFNTKPENNFMKNRNNCLAILLIFFSCSLLNSSLIKSAHAEQDIAKKEHRIEAGIIHGKISDISNVSGYTYVEVDTGNKKIWAAGPTTSLTIGDAIAISTNTPMENYHSKSLNRDFSIIYFVSHFVTDGHASINNNEIIDSAHHPAKQKKIEAKSKREKVTCSRSGDQIHW
jgi:hypothetical protein